MAGEPRGYGRTAAGASTLVWGPVSQGKPPAGVASKRTPERSTGVNQARSRKIMFQAQVTDCAKFLGPAGGQPMGELRDVQHGCKFRTCNHNRNDCLIMTHLPRASNTRRAAALGSSAAEGPEEAS